MRHVLYVLLSLTPVVENTKPTMCLIIIFFSPLWMRHAPKLSSSFWMRSRTMSSACWRTAIASSIPQCSSFTLSMPSNRSPGSSVPVLYSHTPYRTHVQNGKYSIFTALAVNSGVKLHEGHIKCCFMVNLPVSDASSLYLRDDQRPAWLLAGCDVIKFHSVNIEIVLCIGWCVLLSNRATSWSLLTTDSNAHLYPTPLWQLHVKRTTARDYRFWQSTYANKSQWLICLIDNHNCNNLCPTLHTYITCKYLETLII